MIWTAFAASTIILSITWFFACLFSGAWIMFALFYHPLGEVIWWSFMGMIATPIALLAYVLYSDK